MAQGLTIRRVRPGEAESLTALALRSKAHWGYDAEFLESVRELLTFTERDLVDGLVYVLDAGREHVGVHRLTGDPPEGELSDLWLDPRFIGRALGRRLFSHAMDTARAHGYGTLIMEVTRTLRASTPRWAPRGSATGSHLPGASSRSC